MMNINNKFVMEPDQDFNLGKWQMPSDDSALLSRSIQ